MKIKIIDERLYDLPPAKNELDAGLDLRACIEQDFYLHPGQEKLVPSGLAIQLPSHYCGMVLPRSGLGSTHGIVIGNLVGLIDEEYNREILIKMWNRNTEGRPYRVHAMERIAQLVVIPALHYDIEIVDDLGGASRVGFGSSGRM